MSEYGLADALRFAGRFHPVLVHLPIGFLVLLAVIESIGWIPALRKTRHARGVILTLGVLGAMTTAACGWFLAWEGGYERPLLNLHRWLGVGLVIGTMLLAFLAWRRKLAAYYSTLALVMVLLLWTSHLGGSITHGRDFLLVHAPWRQPVTAGPVAASALSTQHLALPTAIQPILDQYCVSCHGPSKAKGELRLDTLDHLLKGGESGPAILRGKSADSLLLQRMLLPLDDEDHMPPEGKPQPTEAELATIRAWIDGDPKSSQHSVVSSQHGNSLPTDYRLLTTDYSSLRTDLAIALSPVAAGEPWLACNASINRSFGDEQLARLKPLAANIRELNLAGTQVTDRGLATVAGMPNLQRLHLENTAITDGGLSHLSGLKSLEYLNLYNTPITEKGLVHLKPLPRLRKLYLWGTQVSPEAAKAFAATKADKDLVQRLQKQIDELQSQIRSASIEVNAGSVKLSPTTAPSPSARSTP